MKLIPFNLERCIAGDAVVTRDGKGYLYGVHDPRMTKYPLIGWVEGVPHSCNSNGKIYYSTESNRDLFMKPKKITRWIYVDNGWGYPSKEAAISSLRSNVDPEDSEIAALIKIEFYPGEGLE